MVIIVENTIFKFLNQLRILLNQLLKMMFSQSRQSTIVISYDRCSSTAPIDHRYLSKVIPRIESPSSALLHNISNLILDSHITVSLSNEEHIAVFIIEFLFLEHIHLLRSTQFDFKSFDNKVENLFFVLWC